MFYGHIIRGKCEKNMSLIGTIFEFSREDRPRSPYMYDL